MQKMWIKKIQGIILSEYNHTHECAIEVLFAL